MVVVDCSMVRSLVVLGAALLSDDGVVVVGDEVC